MRRRSLAAAGLLLLVCAAGAGASSGVHVTVTPAAGHPATSFAVSYVAPTATGVIRSIRLRDEISVRSSTSSTSCQSTRAVFVPSGVRGRHVRMMLRPGAGWCAGTYSGKLAELQSPVCPPGALCPQYLRIRTLGTFSFVVE